MDLFHTIGGVVSTTYAAVARKNKQTAMNNRLKTIVRSEMGAINRAYLALGKHYYNTCKDSATGDEALLCNAIDQAKERIERARQRLSEEEKSASAAQKTELEEPVNDDVFTEQLRESPIYHPFVTAAQEAEDDGEIDTERIGSDSEIEL